MNVNPNKHQPYRLVAFSRIVLYKLYFLNLNDDSKSSFDVDDIISAFSVPVSRNFTAAAINFLRSPGHPENALLTRHRKTNKEEYWFRITHRGFETIEGWLRDKGSDVAYFHEHGDNVLNEVAGIDGVFLTQEEALQSDAWSPLPIDRRDPAYLQAVEDVENALEVIRGDNGFATNLPAEREGILATLEDGLKWLKERSPTRAQVFSLLVSPLQWLSAYFARAVIGEAAKKAAQSVIDFLHTFF